MTAGLLALLEEGSRWIDDYCNRHFYVLETARQFEVNFGSYQSGGWRQLLVPDLVAVSSLRTWHIPPGAAAPATGPAWDAADYRLYPRDAGPTRAWGRPYTRVAVNGDAPAVRGRAAGAATLEITGRWGFREVKESSGTTLKAGAPLTATATGLTLAAAGRVSVGQTLSIEAEQLYVTAVNGAAATVARGVNGTTAAAHPAETPVLVYRYPGPVVEACLQVAAQLWHSRSRFALAGGGREPAAAPLPGPEVLPLLAAYRKLPV